MIEYNQFYIECWIVKIFQLQSNKGAKIKTKTHRISAKIVFKKYFLKKIFLKIILKNSIAKGKLIFR